jgi:tetratricopeptide (TPR) repeat protein
MTTMMSVDLDCPNCKSNFETRALASTNNFGGTCTDFRRRAVGFEPLQFLVHACPDCGFSGPEEWFEETLSEEIRSLLSTNLEPLAGAEPAPWRKFEQAAHIARLRSMPALEIADLYLRAAHLCASYNEEAAHGSEDEEKANREKAIAYFQQSIDAGETPRDELPTITYLVGELYRRVGRVHEAHVWLEKAERMASEQVDLAWLVSLSRQQRSDPKEMIGLKA